MRETKVHVQELAKMGGGGAYGWDYIVFSLLLLSQIVGVVLGAVFGTISGLFTLCAICSLIFFCLRLRKVLVSHMYASIGLYSYCNSGILPKRHKECNCNGRFWMQDCSQDFLYIIVMGWGFPNPAMILNLHDCHWERGYFWTSSKRLGLNCISMDHLAAIPYDRHWFWSHLIWAQRRFDRVKRSAITAQ